MGQSLHSFHHHHHHHLQTELHALSDYETMIEEDYNSNYVSYKKDDIKCNNINVNLNGFNGVDVNAGIPPNDAIGEAQVADEGQKTTASAFGNDEKNNNGYQHNNKDFAYVCINNNDNRQRYTNNSTNSSTIM